LTNSATSPAPTPGRYLAPTLLALALLPGCGPHRIALEEPIDMPPERSCLLETVRLQQEVLRAGVGENGVVWAELDVPDDMRPRPESSVVRIETVEGEEGGLELRFEQAWLGDRGSPAYNAYVQGVVADLRHEVRSRCGGRWGPAGPAPKARRP